MKGGSILIGGEPGIGKSTLMLQIAGSVKTAGRVLYISGEESPEQLKQRAERLGITNDRLEVLSETELNSVLWVIESVKPVIIIVDSVQTLHSPELGAVPGTVNQIKYCSQEIISWVRERLCAVFFVAHVTKEGFIAGPKVMEHMVDTVIYFDRSDSDVRFLRPTKNRFGAIDEIGLFTMQNRGLIEVRDPSSLFMIHREESVPAGLSVAAVYEGSRILLVELQALTVPAKSSISRVFSDRIDSARVSRIAAVMEKHVGLRFSDQDIYVNVAGGIRLTEVGIDLPLAMALYSARSDIPIPVKTAIAGEVSLAGEVRPIPHQKRRVKAAAEIGFENFVGPEDTTRQEGTEQSLRHKVKTVKSVKEAIRALFS
jgi:DNA repair protein RadA/Sms